MLIKQKHKIKRFSLEFFPGPLNGTRAQTMLEYLTLIGLVTVVLITMTTPVKRGIQLMVKVVADQIGVQKDSDQKKTDDGYLKEAWTISRADIEKETKERIGSINYIFDDTIKTDSVTISNLGFTKKEN